MSSPFVLVTPKIMPFYFEKHIPAGSLVQVICSVREGDSPIEIRWTLHGDEISPSSGIFTQRISERTSILSVNSVGSEHRGTYTCHASNPAGTSNFTQVLWVDGDFFANVGNYVANIITIWQWTEERHGFAVDANFGNGMNWLGSPGDFFLSVPPRIIPFAFEDHIHAGSFVQVTCTVGDGDSPLEIKWTAHGEKISPSSGIFTQRISERTSILSVNSVGAEHRGTYSCLASNPAGTTNITRTLDVNGDTRSTMTSWY
ncbi:hypothetical protein HAZT_HAZT008155 [Hyalella azteca]|uniref:Ig-like domain-containing protein n=1 Tax=Hyalella azteca TaxID=294128 RepID=A0A6A0HBA1_HYAAZ|nr:hypothetical protein HAZT_HAZT008155 [Hyalella azteca]